MDKEGPWLTVEQIAAHLNIAPITIYRWIESQKIPCHKVGRQWRFKSKEVDEWVLNGEATKANRKKGSSTDESARSRKSI